MKCPSLPRSPFLRFLAGLVLVTVAGAIIGEIASHRAVQKTKCQLRDLGRPMDLMEILPPAVGSLEDRATFLVGAIELLESIPIERTTRHWSVASMASNIRSDKGLLEDVRLFDTILESEAFASATASLREAAAREVYDDNLRSRLRGGAASLQVFEFITLFQTYDAAIAVDLYYGREQNAISKLLLITELADSLSSEPNYIMEIGPRRATRSRRAP